MNTNVAVTSLDPRRRCAQNNGQSSHNNSFGIRNRAWARGKSRKNPGCIQNACPTRFVRGISVAADAETIPRDDFKTENYAMSDIIDV